MFSNVCHCEDTGSTSQLLVPWVSGIKYICTVLMSWECLKLRGCACKDSKFCLLETVAPLVVNKESSVCLPYTGGNLCMLSCRGGRHQSWNFFYRTSYTYLCNQHYSCCSNFFHKSNSSITLHNTLLKAYLLLEL